MLIRFAAGRSVNSALTAALRVTLAVHYRCPTVLACIINGDASLINDRGPGTHAGRGHGHRAATLAEIGSDSIVVTLAMTQGRGLGV